MLIFSLSLHPVPLPGTIKRVKPVFTEISLIVVRPKVNTFHQIGHLDFVPGIRRVKLFFFKPQLLLSAKESKHG